MRKCKTLITAITLGVMLFTPAASGAEDRPSSVSAQLEISGEVQHAMTLSIEDVRSIGKRREFIHAGAFAGVRLTDLLEEAEIRRDAPRALRRTYVVASATDGYQAVFSWGELYNSPLGHNVLIAIEQNGELLKDGEGRFTLLSLSDDKSGPRHVKWLKRIEVRRIPEDSEYRAD